MAATHEPPTQSRLKSLPKYICLADISSRINCAQYRLIWFPGRSSELAAIWRPPFRHVRSAALASTAHSRTSFGIVSSLFRLPHRDFSTSFLLEQKENLDLWSSCDSCMFEKRPPLDHWQDRQHWGDVSGKWFRNPWPSFNPSAASKWEIFLKILFHPKKVPVPDNIHEIYRVVKPEWSSFQEDKVRATWIGHATFVVELPKQDKSQKRGIRVLFDPVFSEYTSPAFAARLGLGPKRYSKLPCTVDELPEIDVVCLSHNHYDHLDLLTVKSLEARTNGTMQYICGLNNRRHFTKFGVAPGRVHEMDWGDQMRLTVGNLSQSFDMSCCPAQHTSARTLTDTDHSLWCSWLITTPQTTQNVSKKIFFLGDTGYRYTPTEDRAGWPVNPVFKEIGEEFGKIDLAMIPIGLYSPRNLLSNVHLCPEDSAEVHIDIKSRKSIGMHFGTFRGGLSRNYEDVLEPPRRLAAALKKLDVPEDEFTTIDIGGHMDV